MEPPYLQRRVKSEHTKQITMAPSVADLNAATAEEDAATSDNISSQSPPSSSVLSSPDEINKQITNKGQTHEPN